MKKKATVPRNVTKISNVKPDLKSNLGNSFDYYLMGLGILIIFISYIRFRLMSIPLERDEGEYAYLGKLILQGIPPYKEAYNMKLPGTYFMYAFLMGVFGQTINGIHFGLLLVNVGTILLFYFGLKRLYNASIGLITVSVFGIISISPNLLGFAAHATHFVTLFVSAGVYFYSLIQSQEKYSSSFLTGLMFGLAFLMKQQAVFFIIFGGIIMLLPIVLEKPTPIKKSALHTLLYSLGAVSPYIITVLIMMFTGVFTKFWFWTVEYASKYAAGVSLEEGKMLFGMSFKPMWDEFTIVWVLAIAGVVVIFLTKWEMQKKLFAIAFSLFAFLSISPGFYFRQHYFIPLIPAVGLLVAITLDYIANLGVEKMKIKYFNLLPVIVILIVIVGAVSKGKVYYFKAKPIQLSKMIYGTNPFIESVEIGKFIKENSKEGDKVAVLGSEPQIFLYADRNSATGYIYTYGLMEIHDYNRKMQEEMISEIEMQKPAFLVFCRVNTSWLSRPGSPTLIFDWFNKYSKINYDLVGLADMAGQSQTNYYWNDEVKRIQPQGQEYVLIYKRKLI